MIEQGSPEWFAERCGKVTASRVADVIARTKSGWGASRANYMADLIAERLTGFKSEGYVNSAMQHGIDTEPQARDAYEFYAGVEVAQVGFIAHPTISMTGASPDGLVGETGLVEIKCPSTATHIDTLLSGKIAEKYVTQMMWQMACTGRKWCDFVSFDPRLPEEMRIWIHRVQRDDKVIKALEIDVEAFLAELDEKVTALRSKYEVAQAA
jgi:putative phage-type endonuclease